jgi:murein DD-endopeptidase MepM/ murein hydrolase activator NlpD
LNRKKKRLVTIKKIIRPIYRNSENPLKNKLILSKKQDFDPLSPAGQDNKGHLNIKRITLRGLLTSLVIAFVILGPNFLKKEGSLSFLPSTVASSGPRTSESNDYKSGTSTKQNAIDEINSLNMNVLQAAVNIDPNPAKGGGDITILDKKVIVSESGVSGTNLDIEKNGHRGRISLYEVREGDTLSQIAEMFGVSVNTIRWANDLSGSIQPGQSLVILPVNGLTHIVKNGGTIIDVAKIYEADVREIALFNGLDENVNLKPGDETIVPNVDPQTDEPKTSVSNLAKTPSKNQKPSLSGASYYINPVPGGIITQGIHGYNSIDIAASQGTPILAAASGKVITSKAGGWNGGYGNYIVISHENGTQTLYSHNSRNIVYVGQFVEKGEVVGYMGSTGRSTGNHLHFEVRGATNPLTSCAVGSVCR